MGSPVPSDIETGIDLENLGKVGTQWLLFFIYLSLSLTLTGVSVGLRCQISVSVGCEIRKLGGKYASIIYLLLLYPYLWELNG